MVLRVCFTYWRTITQTRQTIVNVGDVGCVLCVICVCLQQLIKQFFHPIKTC